MADLALLDAFSEEFADKFSDGQLETEIQAVKDALYRRSYVEAFGSEANLRAYVVRWSPSRALAYADIFRNYKTIRDQLNNSGDVLCIGGGAGAEIAALSTFSVNSVTTIDIGDWEKVVNPLATRLNVPLKAMIHGDALTADLDLTQYNVITSLFTTNELFAESKAGAVKFFKRLAPECPNGTVLVILESAGSYSHIEIGSKKFPVHFIVHHSLGPAWQLKHSVDSEWFRLPAQAQERYPLQLQSMRYFLRVYQLEKIIT